MPFAERDLPVKICALSTPLRRALDKALAQIPTLGVAACLGIKHLEQRNINPVDFKNELEKHYGFTLDLSGTAAARIKAVYGTTADAPATVAVALRMLTEGDLRTFLKSMGPSSKTDLSLGDSVSTGGKVQLGVCLAARRLGNFLNSLVPAVLAHKTERRTLDPVIIRGIE